MSTISFKTSKQDTQLISKIAERYAPFYKGEYPETIKLLTEMDLTAVHCNDMPLDFEKLLKADAFNLAHDVVGIRNHLDRKTGKLRYFLPRCAMPQMIDNHRKP